MSEPIRRLKGRMVRAHYHSGGRCACQAWCEGYNERATEEREYVRAVASVNRAMQKPPPRPPADYGPAIEELVRRREWLWTYREYMADKDERHRRIDSYTAAIRTLRAAQHDTKEADCE